MTKTELIAKNIHEKSTGIQIINRLLKSGHIAEDINQKDKRSKKITITSKGIKALDEVMVRIREASRIVTGDLTEKEKSELIVLLQKLEHFHSLGIKELQI
jgi:DNA-binding MarR family transcriptional regulator